MTNEIECHRPEPADPRDTEIAALRAAIEGAPHYGATLTLPGCASIYHRDANCTCWKATALRGGTDQ